jgi:hypothetical protein
MRYFQPNGEKLSFVPSALLEAVLLTGSYLAERQSAQSYTGLSRLYSIDLRLTCTPFLVLDRGTRHRPVSESLS